MTESVSPRPECVMWSYLENKTMPLQVGELLLAKLLLILLVSGPGPCYMCHKPGVYGLLLWWSLQRTASPIWDESSKLPGPRNVAKCWISQLSVQSSYPPCAISLSWIQSPSYMHKSSKYITPLTLRNLGVWNSLATLPCTMHITSHMCLSMEAGTKLFKSILRRFLCTLHSVLVKCWVGEMYKLSSLCSVKLEQCMKCPPCHIFE